MEQATDTKTNGEQGQVITEQDVLSAYGITRRIACGHTPVEEIDAALSLVNEQVRRLVFALVHHDDTIDTNRVYDLYVQHDPDVEFGEPIDRHISLVCGTDTSEID